MSIQEWITAGGGATVLLMTILQITPIQIDPWSWLATRIGRAINGDRDNNESTLQSVIDDIYSKLSQLGL